MPLTQPFLSEQTHDHNHAYSFPVGKQPFRVKQPSVPERTPYKVRVAISKCSQDKNWSIRCQPWPFLSETC